MEETSDHNLPSGAGGDHENDGCGFLSIFKRSHRQNSQEEPAEEDGPPNLAATEIPVAQNVKADQTSPEVTVLEIEKEYISNPDHCYNMTAKRRGKMIIISNRTFLESSGMDKSPRHGTEFDAENLRSAFSFLGFECDVHEDKTCSQMLQIFIDASNSTDYDCDCMAFALLTHGDDFGIVYGIDCSIPLDSLLSPLKHNANMAKFAGKPKLIIVQACRGTKLDEGVEVTDMVDGCVNRKRIPTEADFLYAYSTVPGYFSFRGSRGSVFIRTICEMLRKYWQSLDLVKIMTRVNFEVAYYFQTVISQENPNYDLLSNKKQMPSIVSMLTKDVYFVPRRSTPHLATGV